MCMKDAPSSRSGGRGRSRPQSWSDPAKASVSSLGLFTACALEDTLFLEVSTPELDDVVRLEDRYGRL